MPYGQKYTPPHFAFSANLPAGVVILNLNSIFNFLGVNNAILPQIGSKLVFIRKKKQISSGYHYKKVPVTHKHIRIIYG